MSASHPRFSFASNGASLRPESEYCIEIGTHHDDATISVPWKLGGATPMTVNGRRLSVTVLPRMAGSAAKRLRQNASLRTTTSPASVDAHSLGEKARPRRGETGCTLKETHVVSSPCTGLTSRATSPPDFRGDGVCP